MNEDINSLYTKIGKDFYHKQRESKNPLRSWFHSSRYRIANSLVSNKYKEGKKVIDLGCGSCDWNTNYLDVFGVDINENLLRHAKNKNRLSDYKIADAANTGLPDESFDLVTAFEFLEHVEHYEKVIAESKRLLKRGGHCIISVPFDVFLSLWKPLFSLQVLFQGFILQDNYYKRRCGHVNQFSVEKIKKAFLKHGYKIDFSSVMRWFTIFLCAQKER